MGKGSGGKRKEQICLQDQKKQQRGGRDGKKVGARASIPNGVSKIAASPHRMKKTQGKRKRKNKDGETGEELKGRKTEQQGAKTILRLSDVELFGEGRGRRGRSKCGWSGQSARG